MKQIFYEAYAKVLGEPRWSQRQLDGLGILDQLKKAVLDQDAMEEMRYWIDGILFDPDEWWDPMDLETLAHIDQVLERMIESDYMLVPVERECNG